MLYALVSYLNLSSYRMKYMLSGINLQRKMCLNEEYAVSYNRIIAAVDFHRRAIEFVFKLKLHHILSAKEIMFIS